MTAFSVAAPDLYELCAWARQIIPARPSMPVLSGLMVDVADTEITVSAFDYETSVSGVLPILAGQPGRFLVSGRLLTDVVKAAGKSDVTLDCSGSSLTVSAGKSSWSLPLLPAEDYPQLPELGKPVGSIGSGALSAVAARVSVAAGKDDALPTLTGIKMESAGTEMTFTATDRFRLATAVCDWSPAAEFDTLIPAELLGLVTNALAERIGEVAIFDDGSSIGFATDTHRVTGRRLAAEYPRWRPLLTVDDDHWAELSVAGLAFAVGQVLALGEAQLALEFGPDVVTVSAVGDDRKASAEAAVSELAGDPVRFGANPQFVREALASMKSERCRVTFGSNPNRPVLVTPVGDGSYRHLLMPVRLQM